MSNRKKHMKVGHLEVQIHVDVVTKDTGLE